MRKNKYFKDFFVILLLLLFVALSYLFINMSNEDTSFFYVYSNGRLLNKYSVDIDCEYEINSEFGTNIICVSNKNIYIDSSSCHNKDCINQGKINSPGQSIICLPNRLVISFENNMIKEDNDAIVY